MKLDLGKRVDLSYTCGYHLGARLTRGFESNVHESLWSEDMPMPGLLVSINNSLRTALWRSIAPRIMVVRYFHGRPP